VVGTFDTIRTEEDGSVLVPCGFGLIGWRIENVMRESSHAITILSTDIKM
jgi:hypothetical protein